MGSVCSIFLYAIVCTYVYSFFFPRQHITQSMITLTALPHKNTSTHVHVSKSPLLHTKPSKQLHHRLRSSFYSVRIKFSPKVRAKARRVVVIMGSAIKASSLRFRNERGEELVGLFVDAGSDDVVVLCHGYMANKDMCNFGLIADTLANEAGVSSFRFDHPCAWRGESERKGPFLMGNHEDEVSDIVAAVKFIKNSSQQVKRNVTCILGHSKGGTNVIKYAAEVGDIPKVINLSGRFCVRQGLFQRFGKDILERLAEKGDEGIPRKEADGFEWVMKLNDFQNRADLPMEGYAAAIKKARKVQLLCLHGRQDTTVPWQESELCAQLSGGQLKVIPGDHNFRSQEAACNMVGEIINFLRSNEDTCVHSI
jgi:dienelactone hydrolase